MRKLNQERYKNVWKAKSLKHLRYLWVRFTKHAKRLEPSLDKTYGEPISKARLKDGTIISFRQKSKSGTKGESGHETIDIRLNDEIRKEIGTQRKQWKIHYEN